MDLLSIALKFLNLFHESQHHHNFDNIQGTPRLPDPPGTAIYGNPAYIICMTRKDKMKEGFVARTFHIPMDLDEKL
jgi:hypothetical protein